MLSWWAHWRAIDTNTRTNLDSRTPTHTQHKEISPFSTTQSLRPWSPFECYSGVVEKKSNSVALSVWFSTHQVYQAPQALIHHSNVVRGQNHCMQASKQLFKLLQGKNTANQLWKTVAHKQLWTHITRSSRQSLEKLPRQQWGKKSILNLCVRGKRHCQST